MSQIQTFQREWKGHQKQPNQKHVQLYETEPNQKAIEWLETQTQLKEWQRAKNFEPIVVINHLDSSEHDILTMVEQVLTKNEFSDDSSIFVVVPSIDNDAGNSSNHPNSSVCMQMCEKPVTLKNKDNPLGRDPKQHRNSTTHEGVKLYSKGKMFFTDVLPTDIPCHNKAILCDRKNPTPKGDCKKGTKNKLCQISTPNSIVERVENQRNAVSVDTTVDRPCCCSAKTNQYSKNNPNDRQVANVISNVIMPQGMVDTSFYTGWRMTPRESVNSAKLPLAPCNIPLSRLYRTQHYNAAPPQQFTRDPIQQLTCAPTQQSSRAVLQQHTRAPIRQLTCAPTHLTWALDRQCPTQNRDEACCTQLRDDARFPQNRDEACRTQLRGDARFPQNRDEACPTQLRGDAYFPQNRNTYFPQNRDVCFPQNHAEEYPTLQHTQARSTQQQDKPCPIQNQGIPKCQCSPEQLLELFKLAVTGGKLYGIPTICGEYPDPETLARAPPAEPAPGDPGDDEEYKYIEDHKLDCSCSGKEKSVTIAPLCPCDSYRPPMPPMPPMSKTAAGPKAGTRSFGCQCCCCDDSGTKSDTEKKMLGPAGGVCQMEPGGAYCQAGRIITQAPTTTEKKKSCTCNEDVDGKPEKKRGFFSRKKSVICECPQTENKVEPEPEPEPFYMYQYVDDKQVLRQKSDMTQTQSGFRMFKKKKPPIQPESEFTVEDAVRYYVAMNPDFIKEFVPPQPEACPCDPDKVSLKSKKKKKNKVQCDCQSGPDAPPGEASGEAKNAAAPEPEPEKPEDEGPIGGLKFTIGGKGSGSKGLNGICCFDMIQKTNYLRSNHSNHSQ